MNKYLQILPEEIYQKIFMHYFKKYISPGIETHKLKVTRWQKPSDRLIELCNERGSYQMGSNVYSGLEPLFGDYDDYKNCGNCEAYFFPCMNCACYYTENIGVCQFWNIRKNPKDIRLSGSLLRREEIDKIRT